ncbi:MAG TPA: hypothetical protein ENK05_10345 [Gammaproteobacteria bacterium]|nr:hypothetical protein [Gammaproteobacteria bacterium]
MTNHNNVVVFVCLQDRNLNVELLELALHSLRGSAGYQGDIVVFTDFHRRLKGEDGLSLRRIHVDRYPSQDPRNFRIYMDDFYDFSVHQNLVYLDFDILVLKDIEPAFSCIRDDAIHFTYAPVFPWASEAFMAGPYLGQYRNSPVVKGSLTGICSGIFGIRTTALGRLLRVWREVLARTPSNNDQHALNELIVKGMVEARPYPNEWVSYPVQVRQESDDRRVFSGERDFIFYHFNPVANQVKYRLMREYLGRHDAAAGS